MREIIGLDIGTKKEGSGVVCIRTSASVHDPVSADNTDLVRCCMMQNSLLLAEARRFGRLEQVVFEGISSYGKKVGGDIFGTLKWIWRIFEAVDSRRQGGPEPVIVLKRVVSAHLVGARGKGDPTMDKMITLALAERFVGMGATRKDAVGLVKTPGPLYGVAKDMWAAVAVAVAYAEGAAVEQP